MLVVYGSGEGQTAKVAHSVEDILEERGHEVTVRNVVDAADVTVDTFDAVLVGSPVHNRKHLPAVVDFVDANRETLTDRPSGFFQLSLAATMPFGWAERGDEGFVESLVARTDWHPDRVGTFAGAVKYSQYDPLERVLFKLVAAITTGDTDTSRDYEYTDWDDVESFAVEFAEYVEDHLASERSERGQTGVRRFARVTAGIAVLVGVVGVAYWAATRRVKIPEC
jgi:menaquinone-dependent protoporphyrinogen oxidase